tara:strand:- start:158 stop:298 length:141 start_codon:yes stop_codon:yes gene_type:complete
MTGQTVSSQGSLKCRNCGAGRFVGHEASNTEACGIAPVGRYVAGKL